jgi:hypothetical protein
LLATSKGYFSWPVKCPFFCDILLMAFQFFLKMDHLESSRIENLFMDIRGFQGRGSFKGKVGNKMIEYQYSII